MLSHDHRLEPRFLLSSTVELREPETEAVVLAHLQNVSLSGCFLQTPYAARENARVRVVIHTKKIRADLWGIVRRREAAGLGIQFTNGATVEDWKRLEMLIEQLQTSPAEQTRC